MSETRKALEGTREALVLGYHHDGTTAQFEFVCESLDKNAGADRAFVRFQFSGVRLFQRTLGLHRKLHHVGSTFVLRAVAGAWIVQAVRIRKVGAFNVASISLGESFGSIGFKYKNATHQLVHLYAKPKEGNDWEYFEVGTDRRVDFYNPFGSPWADVE